MSEYQYYEFQAIDRPLSEAEQAHVRTLSRRVQVTPTQAIFTYSYGDFPGDPLTLLETHFDALLYTANWGTRELAFRFPQGLLDLEPLQQYDWSAGEITLKTTEHHVVLDLHFHDEDRAGWIEGEGLLATLTPLRADILHGDLRTLYLAYLKTAQHAEEMDKDDEELDDGLAYLDADTAEDDGPPVEPAVPPGLDQLSAPLRSFCRLLRDRRGADCAGRSGQPATGTQRRRDRTAGGAVAGCRARGVARAAGAGRAPPGRAAPAPAP